jgi:hypothetical protein
MLLRATCLAIVVTGVCAATPAFAAGTTTDMTVTSKATSTFSGQPAVFRATVTPTAIGKTRISGTVTWTITGQNGSTVTCTTTNKFNASGVSVCKVGKALLLAAASPYDVTASYSGDANFAPVSNSLSYVVTPAVTHLRITYMGKPASGTSTTVVATINAGPGSTASTGDITFAIAASMSTKGVKPYCAGSNPVPSENNTQPLVNGVTTCVLPVGWIALPAPTTAVKHPKARWTFTASYPGDGSFTAVTATRMGIATH